MKAVFTMADPDVKGHSVRFHFAEIESLEGTDDDPALKRDATAAIKKTSFYIPKPFAEKSKRIRVTIEEL
jgi:hypothetical protein